MASRPLPSYQQEVPIKPARITYQLNCDLETFGAVFDLYLAGDHCVMATVNLAELLSENATGPPAPGGSTTGYPPYIIASQQVDDRDDAMCYNVDLVKVACDCFQDGFGKF